MATVLFSLFVLHDFVLSGVLDSCIATPRHGLSRLCLVACVLCRSAVQVGILLLRPSRRVHALAEIFPVLSILWIARFADVLLCVGP
jgi:hypothetical protein